ncbi:DNA glycosylase A/G-specific MutY [Acetobacter tropicalis NRIC 0312]|uniref:Adenine DNA glycosylase n=1 Tax=Acetobacter tropicalis TaxID=104102 RepID=A0A511FR70_9PROT|nr:DNA glycosylase A/G-specific MutY [Acetobacter tropicalis NRIC 0312]GEL51439.1 A/G-specific adenine glycosylase [Acetobacter tropicalis]
MPVFALLLAEGAERVVARVFFAPVLPERLSFVITSSVKTPPARSLLDWYDRHRRVLPWRSGPGQTADPYAVWLSEIMLQQTTVKAVGPYYHRFLEKFPTVQALAAADRDDVLSAWAGLGYYSRARNLHACAQKVVELGGFPNTVEGLLTLPGIGAYTAAAVAAIAFGVPVVPVDGNVERITSRLFVIEEPLPASRKKLAALASGLNADKEAQKRPSDFAQALFDLGASLCSPRSPACGLCPWVTVCAAHKAGIAATLPRRAPKAVKPVRYGAHFLVIDAAGQVLLRKRPEKGLLAAMTELPGTPWRTEPWSTEEALTHAPVQTEWQDCGMVKHVFTHFTLQVTVYAARISRFSNQAVQEGFLAPATGVDALSLPSLMLKCIKRGMKTLAT